MLTKPCRYSSSRSSTTPHVLPSFREITVMVLVALTMITFSSVSSSGKVAAASITVDGGRSAPENEIYGDAGPSREALEEVVAVADSTSTSRTTLSSSAGTDTTNASSPLRGVAKEKDAAESVYQESFSSLRKLQIVNVAKDKPAKQSSQYGNYEASRAVDGNTNGHNSEGSITHTKSGDNPYWQVDLVGTYRLDEIKIFNREDCCKDRLKNFEVIIKLNGVEVWTYSDRNSIPPHMSTLTVPSVLGDSIVVKLPGKNRVLTLAEVEAYGKYEEEPDVILEIRSDLKNSSGKSMCLSQNTRSLFDRRWRPKLVVRECNGDLKQKWIYHEDLTIRPASSNTKCLTMTGDFSINIQNCMNFWNYSQKWVGGSAGRIHNVFRTSGFIDFDTSFATEEVDLVMSKFENIEIANIPSWDFVNSDTGESELIEVVPVIDSSDDAIMSEAEVKRVMSWIKSQMELKIQGSCWKDSYGRGLGAGRSRVADCPATYTNTGLTCGRGSDDYWAGSKTPSCPSGYTNVGLFCGFGGYWGVDTLGPSSFICPNGYFLNTLTARCHKHCMEGYTNTGETCHRVVSILGIGAMSCKSDETIIVGRCYKCHNDEELDGLLCYPKCRKWYDGVGPVCWGECHSDLTNCGLFCAADALTCALEVTDNIVSATVVAANMYTMGAAIPVTKSMDLASDGLQVGVKTYTLGSKVGKSFIKAANFLQSVNPGKANYKLAKRIFIAKTGGAYHYKAGFSAVKMGGIGYKSVMTYHKEYSDAFAEMTSKRINEQLDKHFDYDTATWLKSVWADKFIDELNEYYNWNIARAAITGVSLMDITGVLGLINSFVKPICGEIEPFPCDLAIKQKARCEMWV